MNGTLTLWVMLALGRYSSAMSCLRSPREAVDSRNTVGLGIGAKAAIEATRHPHQVSVLQGVNGFGQGFATTYEIMIWRDSFYRFLAYVDRI
jgi:hypothetical protein